MCTRSARIRLVRLPLRSSILRSHAKDSRQALSRARPIPSLKRSGPALGLFPGLPHHPSCGPIATPVLAGHQNTDFMGDCP